MTYQNKTTESILKQHENEKRSYLQRVIQVEQDTFSPLIFVTNGGMGRECEMFQKNLANKLATKVKEQ